VDIEASRNFRNPNNNRPLSDVRVSSAQKRLLIYFKIYLIEFSVCTDAYCLYGLLFLPFLVILSFLMLVFRLPCSLKALTADCCSTGVRP